MPQPYAPPSSWGETTRHTPSAIGAAEVTARRTRRRRPLDGRRGRGALSSLGTGCRGERRRRGLDLRRGRRRRGPGRLGLSVLGHARAERGDDADARRLLEALLEHGEVSLHLAGRRGLAAADEDLRVPRLVRVLRVGADLLEELLAGAHARADDLD